MIEFNIDTFGEIMDEFLERNPVQMLIELPEGTIEPVISDNIGMGGVVQLYILSKAICPIYKEIYDLLLDHSKHEEFIDEILALVKRDLMDVEEETRE